MKTATKTGSLIADFLTSAILSSAVVISLNYYIPFAEQSAGPYNIIMILGSPLRDFLIKILMLIAGLLALLTFLAKSKQSFANKKIYPYYMIGMGILWIILPFISSYTLSRFTGDLILQSVSGIAIVANTVFMMISVCCGIIAITDVVHNLFTTGENIFKANRCAVILTGIPTGVAGALLLVSVLGGMVGLSGVFIIYGLIAAITGIINAILNR